jgi:hypothetical protein
MPCMPCPMALPAASTVRRMVPPGNAEVAGHASNPVTNAYYYLGRPAGANGDAFRDLGYLVGQAAFYVLVAMAVAGLTIWLWRRRR